MEPLSQPPSPFPHTTPAPAFEATRQVIRSMARAMFQSSLDSKKYPRRQRRLAARLAIQNLKPRLETN